MQAVGEAASHLTWLSPDAASLVALARFPTPASWAHIRTDPGAVLLLLRHAPASASFPDLIRNSAVLEEAFRHLDDPETRLPAWNAAAASIYAPCLKYADLSRRLAEQIGRVDADQAWAAGLLAPLGWLAVCGVDPDDAIACLHDPAHAEASAETQRRRWGLDQAGIARRLVRRWRLPHWLGTVAGYLALPVEMAEALGAEPELFRVVQLAVALVQGRPGGLNLAVPANWTENASALGLSTAEVQAIASGEGPVPASREWTAPASVPLLRDLLSLAAENRRLAESPVLERLETDVDELHRALEEQQHSEAARLHARNLGTLAEFAAGAGHEINNPLAVISGQAQYLLGHEAEPARQRSLHTIIHQAQRIHEILTELMQFARPPRPQKRIIDVGTVIREVAAGLHDLAAQRQVRLLLHEPPAPIDLSADPKQLRTALTCLLRNAIEAAPAEGWAGVRVDALCPDRLALIVEDNGDGPTAQQREHMFDPFYSGRQAGRGRGLGLPTAWRLAREHGGNVSFDAQPNGPTRFILSLPRDVSRNGSLAG